MAGPARPALLTLLVVVVCLAATAWYVDLQHHHIYGMDHTLNDQVGFITAARNLAERGRLESNIIFPSTLLQNTERHYTYMPGHYLALASSYWLLGYGVVQSRLPNAIGYVVAALGVLYLGQRLYGERCGLLASLLVALFLPNLLFLQTAMSELTLVGAGVAVLCLFLAMPEGMRLVVGPLLIALPVAFRETGAALLFPMAGLLALRASPRRTRATVAFLATSLAVAAASVFLLTRDRGSLFLPNVVHGLASRASVADAYSSAETQLDLGLMLQWFSKCLADNLETARGWWREGLWLQATPLVATIVALVALAHGAFRRRDAFFLGSGVAAGLTLLAVIVGGHLEQWRGARHALFVWPVLAVCLAKTIDDLRHRRLRQFVTVGILVLLAATSVRGVTTLFGDEQVAERRVVEDLAFIRSLDHDRSLLLVSPWFLSLGYVLEDYPVSWSFVPENIRTLQLLDSRHRIGTLVVLVPPNRLLLERLAAMGFLWVRQAPYRGHVYWVARRGGEVDPAAVPNGEPVAGPIPGAPVRDSDGP